MEKQRLSVAEMAKLAEVSQEFIQRCLQKGYLDARSFTSTRRVLQGGEHVRYEEVSAQEVFELWWNSPAGKQRFQNPTMLAELWG